MLQGAPIGEARLLNSGELLIRGTNGGDEITCELSADATSIEVTINDSTQIFQASDVALIRIRAHGGDDIIEVDSEIDIDSRIHCGRGGDEATGGSGNDVLHGGRGNDIITGGDGDDRLFGTNQEHPNRGRGQDTLLGGDGDDYLNAGRAADELDGQLGADTLKGGRGGDLFAPNDGLDEHRDFTQGVDELGQTDDGVNDAPTANPQTVSVVTNTPRTITLTGDDGDPEAQTLSFRVQTLPTSGTLRDSIGNAIVTGTTLPSATVTYTPNTGFNGNDSFTFIVVDSGGTANGGQDTSAPATVSLNVRAQSNQPFAPVTTGSFEDPNLLGTRTDLLAGAPDVNNRTHDNTLTDSLYVQNGFSNPPTYGPHHFHNPNDPTSGHANAAPVVPTGVKTAPLPDVDLVHNLEHGHVWISYNPTLLSSTDLAALQQLIRDGANNSDGSGVGVILTPRAANTTAIALASWAHLQTLNTYDATAVRSFVETNRGHSPEGFITP
jgi:hypothetical protein